LNQGSFYFLNDKYYEIFDDKYLMPNKSKKHGRPCFYSFNDPNYKSIFWMIPISSKVKKYKDIYNTKMKKYGVCDTIFFCDVLGHTRAFLIQNMCPVTIKYVNNIYIDYKSQLPVRINKSFERAIIKKAKKVLALYNKGYNLIFPDVKLILKELLKKENII